MCAVIDNKGEPIKDDAGRIKTKHHGEANLTGSIIGQEQDPNKKTIFRMGDYEGLSGLVHEVGKNNPLNLNEIEGREDISQDLKGALCTVASLIYAMESHETVVTSVQGANPKSFFRTTEIFAIMNNPKVKYIEILTENMSKVGADGHGPISSSKPLSKNEAYQILRDEWLDSSIKKFEKASKDYKKVSQEYEKVSKEQEKLSKEYEEYKQKSQDHTPESDKSHTEALASAGQLYESGKKALASARQLEELSKNALASARQNLVEEHIIAKTMSISTHPFTKDILYPANEDIAYKEEDREREVERMRKIQNIKGTGVDFARSSSEGKEGPDKTSKKEEDIISGIIYTVMAMGNTLGTDERRDFPRLTSQFFDYYKEQQNSKVTEQDKIEAIVKKSGVNKSLGGIGRKTSLDISKNHSRQTLPNNKPPFHKSNSIE